MVYRTENGQRQVLVIFRRGVWDLPKGKMEKHESIEECATREVAEEVGLQKSPQISDRLPDTYHEYQQGGINYGKTTHWFAMQLDQLPNEGFTPQHEEGIQKVRWMPLDTALRRIGYENLVTVLKAFAGRDTPSS
ncbi:MAG: NUDIX domain-containing protein [Fodinibius sp.]|nr:NUDIX domain-containing protein [Fodinibius sp.]